MTDTDFKSFDPNNFMGNIPEESKFSVNNYLEERLISESVASSQAIKTLMANQVEMAEMMYQSIDSMLQGDFEQMMELRIHLKNYLAKAYKVGL